MTAWNAWPLIHDAAFYAVAVPAVLMMGLSKSGFLGGFGSLAVPLMALAIPVPQAAAIMLPLLLVMDATGLQQLWRHCDRDLLRLLLPAGLLGTVVGTLLFGVLSTATVAAVVGALTLLFLAQRLLFPPRADSPAPGRPLGFVLGIASGFTSFVAHAGSPPFNAYVLPLRLNPMRYAATAAVFFAAVNLSKWIPYAWLGLIDLRNMTTSLALMPLAPIGVWLGVWATKRIDPGWFYRLAYAGMALTGAKLLYDGLK
ncbi:sulfite exporter TauE/SafE family protein [uncultured Piscinibacter sp.]|uniref:sulfite exporter TauE/SafE family protein n=1 Tax=uncultured Piscinibacter sp. TaxID=1131835 RepID=UPI00262F03FA|nr:sulfite exporter TauE/SafE family protein [uncultured Piscinibacter sp.]